MLRSQEPRVFALLAFRATSRSDRLLNRLRSVMGGAEGLEGGEGVVVSVACVVDVCCWCWAACAVGEQGDALVSVACEYLGTAALPVGW